MNIPEAIKIIEENAAWLDDSTSHYWKEALKLGIEALKRELENRSECPMESDISYTLLPGETEE